jgi:hypothetical protein
MRARRFGLVPKLPLVCCRKSRRDNPLIRNRVDQEAEAMAQPADPQSVLDAIKEIHDEAEQISGCVDSP